MDEFLARAWENLFGRVGGPLSFRLVLQPAIAAFLAWRVGLQDARTDRPPYTWALLTDGAHRASLIREGWRSVGKVFVMAVLIDIAYQWLVLSWIYPFQALVVAFLLACLPYMLIRGIVNRITHARRAAERRGPA